MLPSSRGRECIAARHGAAFDPRVSNVRDTLVSRATSNVLRMTYTSDEARSRITAIRWQFASAMPRIAYWYNVWKWHLSWMTLLSHLCVTPSSRASGYKGPSRSAKPPWRNPRLPLDGCEYWTMGDSHRESSRRRAAGGHDPDQLDAFRALVIGTCTARGPQRRAAAGWVPNAPSRQLADRYDVMRSVWRVRALCWNARGPSAVPEGRCCCRTYVWWHTAEFRCETCTL